VALQAAWPYVGSDVIGATEMLAAILIGVGYFKPKAGIVGGLITSLMFFTTSTMLLSTPGAITTVNGMKYMSFMGLFLYKDFISLGVSLYLIGQFGKRAIATATR
jgi:reactive chlorine resistance protein C